ncbi:MAG: UTP--glucose-1-phosphate uridylyltransferase GalU [bacterium]
MNYSKKIFLFLFVVLSCKQYNAFFTTTSSIQKTSTKIKAIIPAGGFGTRLLPATKAIPKELLPIIDKPAIQYVIEEGINSGIKCFIIITSKNKKNAIENHFKKDPILENVLCKNNKLELIKSTNDIIKKANLVFLPQEQALGLGHAILTAKPVFGEELVAILLPDDIFTGSDPAIVQLIKIAKKENCSVIAVQEVSQEDVSRYGIIDIKQKLNSNLFEIKDLIEKPSKDEAPSNLAIVGRYVLSPKIFDFLENIKVGHGGEIQLTDGIKELLKSGEKILALKVEGQRHDVGTTLGWLKTNIEFALNKPDISSDIAKYLS